MARYTGPREKINRRFGIALFGPSKSLETRNFPPGQHGARNTRRKTSEYGTALAEKQKLRYQYGLMVWASPTPVLPLVSSPAIVTSL